MCMSMCMDLGWGLIVKNRSEMNVKVCSATFKLIHVCCCIHVSHIMMPFL